jgi:hypothetical protein
MINRDNTHIYIKEIIIFFSFYNLSYKLSITVSFAPFF